MMISSKKTTYTFLVVALLNFVFLAPAFSASNEGALYIKVKATKLRAQPEYWADGMADLKYGDSVQKVEGGSAWWKVKTTSGKLGYVSVSALSAQKIVLSSSRGYSGSQPDSSDVVLAGKGFSMAAEKELAANNKALNFDAVNGMERLKVSEKELAAFIRSGKLG